MEMEIRRASISEKEIIRNLMQFYFYDFSEFVEAHVEEDGLFKEYPYLDDYWCKENHFPYLVISKERFSGFALVKTELSENKKTFSVAEFFVMKKYRRTGLGKAAAHQIFSMHKGSWEVFQLINNKPAQNFWQRVIEEFTDGDFSERTDGKRKTQEFRS